MSQSEFTDLLKPHYNDAVNYCRALCSGSSKAEAEDVMQQALLKSFEQFGSLKEAGKFRSWFFQIITRSFYNAVRKPFWSTFVSLHSDDGKAAFSVYEDDFFDDHQLLIEVLSHIGKKERAALLLFEIGGFSIKEIAAIQNETSESAIKSRLSRTRKKLKEFMANIEEGTELKSESQNSTSHLTTTDLYHETAKVIKEIKSIG